MTAVDHGAERCSDGELAQRVAATRGGDRAAEAALCARFAPRVRAYGLRHLRDASGADDLVQRVLVLMLEKLRGGAVRHPEQIASFVLGSARLCSAEARRKTARSEPLEAGEVALPELSVAPTEPVDREQLARQLAELPERERSVLVMSFFEEASAAEVGASLGIEAGHVRVLRHRALARLRAAWKPSTEGRA